MSLAEKLERSLLLAEQIHSDKQRKQILLDIEAGRERLMAAAKRADRERFRALHFLLLTALAATDDAKDATLD